MNDPLSRIIATELQARPEQVDSAIRLLDEGNTVPFIARYRKEVTGAWTTPNCASWKPARVICVNWKIVARPS